jgi:hypothetical protein
MALSSSDERGAMIGESDIDRGAKLSHLKRRLCDGAPRVGTPLTAAVTGRPETFTQLQKTSPKTSIAV